MKAKIVAAALFLCSATSIAWLILSMPLSNNRPSLTEAVASAVFFVTASAGIFLKPRLGYFVAVVSGVIALHWFSRIELWDFPTLNTWILFNMPDSAPEPSLAGLRVLFVVAVVLSLACSITRLLPVNWTARKRPLSERTWPALVVCFLLTASWYGVSVRPYRIPLIVDRVWPELTLLHVEKEGTQFHETAISVFRDRKLWVVRNDRRLLQYRFTVRGGEGTLPGTVLSRVLALAESPQLKDLHTPPAIPLRSHDAEGWYFQTGRRVFAFTSEYRTEPPKDVIDLFHDLEAVAPADKVLGTSKDVCMGFCYDPLAGLGFAYLNDRRE